MESNSFQERLNLLIEEKNISAYKISKITKLQQSTISNYRSGKNIPKRPTIEAIASLFEVNPDWLEKGVGEKNNPKEYLSDDTSIIIVNEPYTIDIHENKNSNKFIKLPNGQYLMTMPLAEHNIQAGLLDHYQDLDYLADLAQHSIIVDKPVQGRYIAFRVKGDSMEDGSDESIKENSVVSCRELQRQHWNSKLRTKVFPYWVVYTTQSRTPLLKQIIKHDTEKGDITFHSLNDSPEYCDFTLNIDEIQALFYVVDVSKTISRKLSY